MPDRPSKRGKRVGFHRGVCGKLSTSRTKSHASTKPVSDILFPPNNWKPMLVKDAHNPFLSSLGLLLSIASFTISLISCKSCLVEAGFVLCDIISPPPRSRFQPPSLFAAAFEQHSRHIAASLELLGLKSHKTTVLKAMWL